MDFSFSQSFSAHAAHADSTGAQTAPAPRRRGGERASALREANLKSESRTTRAEAVKAHPLVELLSCPAETGKLLNGAAQSIHFAAGDVVFRQAELCRGLYVLLSGRFQRRAERLQTLLTLAPPRTGDLIELAAALGDGQHTYTLTAQTSGSAFMLPMEALQAAFQNYPPLRMQLLAELAREVSRAYLSCRLGRATLTRRRSQGGVEA